MRYHGDGGACVCDAGFELDTDDACVDIDECLTDNGGCGDATYWACTNTPGGNTCAEIDECATNNGGCGDNAQCTNQPGAEPVCTCLPGFLCDPNGVCVPTPECQFVVYGANSSCDGGNCVCDAGFELDTDDACVDIDECLADNGGCGDATYWACTNTPGGNTCADIDECATDNGGCGENAQCTNQDGAVPLCACLSGFFYNPDGVCVPTPECQSVVCGANSSCDGGDCICDAGFEADNDGAVSILTSASPTTAVAAMLPTGPAPTRPAATQLVCSDEPPPCGLRLRAESGPHSPSPKPCWPLLRQPLRGNCRPYAVRLPPCGHCQAGFGDYVWAARRKACRTFKSSPPVPWRSSVIFTVSSTLWMPCCPTSTRTTLTITSFSSVTWPIEVLIVQG